jgi:two-component system, sensor histidine kinase and response regulator
VTNPGCFSFLNHSKQKATMAPTNKKRKNRYFHYQKEILNTISEPASYINKYYKYVFVNSAFNDLYKKQTEEVIGKTFADLWGAGNFEKKLQPGLDKCLNGEEVFLLYEGEIPSGEFKIMEMNFYPHKNRNGRVDGIISTAKDVTEHKKAEKALRESEARLKELNATKDKLFSIIGHDLKGPLNNILGFSELIENGYDKYSCDEVRRYNKIIYQLSFSVSILLENLLTWSRAQRQKLTLSPQNIALNITVEKCFGLMHQNAIQKEIRLKNKISPETVIYADDEMITTVIRNLVSNAIKFTHRGGVISVSAKNAEEDVIIEIRDNGIGIEKERIPNLFNPDENHTNLGTEGEKGTGLGLIICKDFVEKNSGKIWIESEPGEGSAFYISVPSGQS